MVVKEVEVSLIKSDILEENHKVILINQVLIKAITVTILRITAEKPSINVRENEPTNR